MSKVKSKALMAPNSRVGGHLIALDKLNAASSEDIEQIRYLTGRLLACIRENEKSCKEIAASPYEGIDVLLTTLESCPDSAVALSIASSLLEISNLEKKSAVLVTRGTTQVVIGAIAVAFREQPINELLMKKLHLILAKIAAKDRKFGVKARLGGALPITLSLVRTNAGNFDYLLPLLQVMKIYCSNAVNSSNLGKAGAVNSMLRVVATCGKKHQTQCKLALDVLCLLTKSKSNSARALGQGGIPILLSLFYEWHRHDVRNRHTGLRKAILGVIKNITNLKSGRKSFTEADGVKILYGIVLDMPSTSSKELDGIISMISIILRKCFPKNRLPVPTINSCFSFPLPDGEGGNAAMPLPEGEDDILDESDDADDDISSTDDPPPSKEEEPDGFEVSIHQTRSAQDLAMYQKYFKELTDFEEFFRECHDTEEESSDRCMVASKFLISDTNRKGTTSRDKLRKNRHSLPNLVQCSRLNAEEAQFLTDSNSEPIVEQRSQSSMSRCKSAHKHAQHKSSDVASTKGSVKKQTSTRRIPKNSKSSPNLRRSAPSSKYAAHKLSKSLTSLKSLERVIQPEVEEHWEKLEDMRSSLSISQMTLGSSSEGTQLTEKGLTKEDVFPDLDKVSPEFYVSMSAKTRRVQPFKLVAHPDMLGHVSPTQKEPLHERPPKAQRSLIFQDIDRCIRMDSVLERVVYDLDDIAQKISLGDALAAETKETHSVNTNSSSKCPEGPLVFQSLFESGNLRKAIQVRKHEYDLILNSDINTNHHHQWFYFSVSNMRAGVDYRFNIVNFEKLNSQLNFGMQPVMYSVVDALEGCPQWVRVGHDVCYYKNNYARSSAASGSKGKNFYTGAFKISFPHHSDTVYLAYHYPYTYTMLQVHLSRIEASLCEFSSVYYREDQLCETLSGNPCPLVTITAKPLSFDSDGITQFCNRQMIFLSSRVHPGETNSSWVMKGALTFLTSQHPVAQQLRETFIFKIVPMLNPDGVINGSHRCSLSGEDLNRKWANPHPDQHPTIYHTKGLLQYMVLIDKRPLVFCDMHGHSRKKNVFMYGCSAGMSYNPGDLDKFSLIDKYGQKLEDTSYKTLPRILSSIAPAFSLSNSNFVVEKSKDATARVVVWRELGVARSYTMENTYSGVDHGPYKGCQITTQMLEEMGQNLCEGLLKLANKLQAMSTAPAGVVRVPSATFLDIKEELKKPSGEDLPSATENDPCNSQLPEDIDENYGLDYSIELEANDSTPVPVEA